MTTRGDQLERLRASLRITQHVLAELTGSPRTTISKAEKNLIAWRSGPLMKSLAKAFSLSVEEFEHYLDDEMPIEVVLTKARPAIDAARAVAASSAKIEAAANKAVKLADIDDEFAEATSRVLVLILNRDSGATPISELVREARLFAEELREKLNRRPRSHKTSDPPKPRAR